MSSLKKLIKSTSPWLTVSDAFEIIKSKSDINSDCDVAELLISIGINDFCIPFDRSKTESGHPARLHRDYEDRTFSRMDYLLRDIFSGTTIINDIDSVFKNYAWYKDDFFPILKN